MHAMMQEERRHPLNVAAAERLRQTGERCVSPMPVLDLARMGYLRAYPKAQDDDPELLRLANAERPSLQENSLALLQEAEVTPDDLLTIPLEELASNVVDALR
jgi:hypothetical protein